MVDDVSRLTALRNRIDQIDDHIHQLLMSRGKLVEDIESAKAGGPSVPAIRPSREAQMLRRRKEQHKGVIPFSTIEHIWRTIIATFTQAQRPFQVHFAQGDEKLREIAWFHFGALTGFVTHASGQEAVNAVSKRQQDVAIIAPPDSSAWHALVANRALNIVAKTPFEEWDSPEFSAYLVGKLKVESSGYDAIVWAACEEAQLAFDHQVILQSDRFKFYALKENLPNPRRDIDINLGRYALAHTGQL